MLRIRRGSLCAAVAAAALAIPAVATASSGGDYVVVLTAPAGATCPDATQAVVDDYAIAPTATYTASLCGFSATLQRSQVRALRADPRVDYVAEDTGFSG